MRERERERERERKKERLLLLLPLLLPSVTATPQILTSRCERFFSASFIYTTDVSVSSLLSHGRSANLVFVVNGLIEVPSACCRQTNVSDAVFGSAPVNADFMW